MRVATNHWRSRAGSRPLRLGEPWLAPRRGLVLYHWQHRRARARAYYEAIWRWYYHSGAQCIHDHEGSWTDTGAPYWGGFQMTLWFQQTYGARYVARYGLADQWPPAVQIRVTRSVAGGGDWAQWGTRGLCGL